MTLDFIIHEWLSEVGLILFIMSEASVPDNINKEVFFKLLSEGNCYLHTLIKNVWSISVHVDDWSVDNFSDFSAIV